MWAAQGPRKQQHNKLYYVFGDYQGGELVIEEAEDRILSEKEVWHSFDGKNCFHYNLPITNGTKYSIVAYARTKKDAKKRRGDQGDIRAPA